MNLLIILYHILLDFIFPKFCIFCGSYGKYICLKCANSRFEFIWCNVCAYCGREVFKDYIHKECCDGTYLDGLLFVVLYNKSVEKLMYKIKYSGFYAVLEELTAIMSSYLKLKKLEKDFVIISISSAAQKKRMRGFNQSEIIARQIAKATGLKYENILIKTKKTKSQFGQGREARRQNLVNAFVVKSETLPKKVLLVDDVYTTGATLNECAKVLKKNGVSEVMGFVFARSGINI